MASAVLGTVLMLGMMMSLVPGMIMLKNSVADQMSAQRELAERAAYCARNPNVGPPTCFYEKSIPGYECSENDQTGVITCVPRDRPVRTQ